MHYVPSQNVHETIGQILQAIESLLFTSPGLPSDLLPQILVAQLQNYKVLIFTIVIIQDLHNVGGLNCSMCPEFLFECLKVVVVHFN